MARRFSFSFGRRLPKLEEQVQALQRTMEEVMVLSQANQDKAAALLEKLTTVFAGLRADIDSLKAALGPTNDEVGALLDSMTAKVQPLVDLDAETTPDTANTAPASDGGTPPAEV
jgi:chromosome segregation ATPase